MQKRRALIKKNVDAMDETAASPSISRFSWGCIELADGRSYKDVKLFPGGARSWDWRETGTSHEQGIQPADIEELLENGSRVVILSQGVNGRLQVCAETLALLKEKGIDVYVLETYKAIKLYNELRKEERVGGLFHSTC